MSGLSEYQEQQKEEQNLEALLRVHFPLVKTIAHHLISRLPNFVQLSDLIQAGMIGLVQAIKLYDAAKGASFETYASLRIRGSMIDELRYNSPLSQHALRHMRKITTAIHDIESTQHKTATPTDIAEKLGISIEEYYQLAATSVAIHFQNIEDVSEADLNAQSDTDTVLSEIAAAQMKKILSELIDTLSDKERLVMSLYYNDAFTFKAIGEVLGVTEARVSQIHSESLLKLRVKAKKYRQE